LANLYQNELLDRHPQVDSKGPSHGAGRNDVAARKVSLNVEGLWRHPYRLSYHYIANKPWCLLHGSH